MKKKIVIFNGPPGSGKNELAEHLEAFYCNTLNCIHLEMKSRLVAFALCISGLSQTEWDELYTKELKEVKSDKLFGKSPREFLITISENCIKPYFGSDYFSIASIQQFEESGCDVAFYSDGGFDVELDCMVDKYGDSNVMVVKLYREGCSFDNDSRSYFNRTSHLYCVNIYNTGTLDFAKSLAVEMTSDFLRGGVADV